MRGQSNSDGSDGQPLAERYHVWCRWCVALSEYVPRSLGLPIPRKDDALAAIRDYAAQIQYGARPKHGYWGFFGEQFDEQGHMAIWDEEHGCFIGTLCSPSNIDWNPNFTHKTPGYVGCMPIPGVVYLDSKPGDTSMTYDRNTSPIGPIDCTAKAIVDAVYTGEGPQYPIATLNEIANAIITYSAAAQLRPAYVAGHMLEETAAFHFGGDVVPEQFNFGGIGTTGGGVRGIYFGTADNGVRAMVAHECAYIYGALDNWPDGAQSLYNSDPRARYVIEGANAGKVQHIGDLGSGVWAAASNSFYPDAVLRWSNKILELSAGQTDSPVDNGGGTVALEVVDIVDDLMTNTNGGPGYDNNNKVGVIIHYNGPPPNADAYTQYVNDSSYHVNKDWSSNGSGAYGDGIMYHYGIQSGGGGRYPDGTIFRLRDEKAVLWHCGAWVPGGNETGIAINVNIGEGQHISDAAHNSLKVLVNDIRSRRNITSLAMVKGHQEVSPTACPGTMMDDVIYPYRAGDTGGTVVPVVKDNFLHENGHIIGGGFKAIVDDLERVSHSFRMRFLGYAISEEGDGYLCSPEVNGDGSMTGRYHVKVVVLQKFERATLIHEPDQPVGEWQDVVPLVNRGFLAGFATDDAIDAILSDPDVRLDTLTTTAPEQSLDAVSDSGKA
jgi:hypothetical protein